MSAPVPLRRDRGSPAGRLLDAARRVTPRSPSLREQTWRRIERSIARVERREPNRRRRLVALLAATAAAALAAVLVVARQDRHEPMAASPRLRAPAASGAASTTVNEPGPATAGGATGARARLQLGRATLEPSAGARLRVEAPARVVLDDGQLDCVIDGGRLEVTTPALRLIGSRARFAASVEQGATTVEVLEGTLELVGANGRALTLGRGERTRSDDARLTIRHERALTAPARSPEDARARPAVTPPPPHEQRSLRLSQCRALFGSARRACLLALVEADDFVAEVALYSLARDADGQERRRLLDEYARRFPDGAFAPEVAVLRAAPAAASSPAQ